MTVSKTRRLRSIWSDVAVRWRGTIIIAIPVTCLLTTLVAFAWLQQISAQTRQTVDKAQRTLNQTDILLTMLLNAQTAVRGYEGSQELVLLEPYQEAIATFPQPLNQLSQLLGDQPQQLQRLENLQILVSQQINLLQEHLALAKIQPVPRPKLRELLFESRLNMDDIREEIQLLKAEERDILKVQNQRWERQQNITNLLLWLAAVVGILGAVGAFYLFDRLDRALAERALDLRESNVRLRAILDNVVDGIITIDEAGHIESLNKAAEEMFGYESSEVIHQNLKQLIQNPIGSNSQEFLKFFVGTKGVKLRRQQEALGQRKDGETFPLELAFSEMHLGNRHLFIGILRDITDRKDAEAALVNRATELARLSSVLAQTNTQLENRNQELDRFAYIVSHDLKAPLRAIANLAQWIEEDIQDKLTEDTQHQLELLQSRVHRMEALINGLLQYSRVGRMAGNFESVDVAQLLAEIIDSLAPPPEFSIEIESPMPILVTEPLPLEQVFMNLISNAIKHHDRSSGKVNISATDRHQVYEFSVTDDGPGIAPEYHERVFGIFETLKSRDKAENTGVGLAIVKKIVEDKGGKISVVSQGDRGSRFIFTWRKE